MNILFYYIDLLVTVCLFVCLYSIIVQTAKGIEFLPQAQIFLIPLSLQLDGVNLLYFKLRLFNLTEFIV